MRIKPVLLALLLLSSAAPAVAESAVESVARQLGEYGYHSITTNRTLLGRIRITAERDGVMREIVLNRFTGTILFDRILKPSGEADILNDGPGELVSGLGDTDPSASDGSGGASGSEVEDSGESSDAPAEDDHEDSPDSPDGGEEDEVDEVDEVDEEDAPDT